jgi:phospholipase C
LSGGARAFEIQFAARAEIFGERAAGAPFRVYAPGMVRAPGSDAFESGRAWDYAVAAGDSITDRFPLQLFEAEKYYLCVYGPNGFFREFRGSPDDPQLAVNLRSTSDSAALKLFNQGPARLLTITVEDQASGNKPHTIQIEAGMMSGLALDLEGSHGWYDLRIRVTGAPHYEQRYAGHVETGRETFSDPFMGFSEVLAK